MEPNLFATVRQIAAGHWVARCLHVVAELGVADVLGDTPRSAADLAADVAANPDALRRVLRLLAAEGIFEMHDDTFQHSPASRLLRSDHPQSIRPLTRMFGSRIDWAIYGELEHSVRTGLAATTEVFPEGIWAYRTQHPEEGRIFNAAMEARARSRIPAIMAAYDFSQFGLIGDIAGGRGHLLRAVLDQAPNAHGILFDLPSVVEDDAGPTSERLTLRAGDLFHDALPRCDAYILMDVIHDWPDDESVAILKAVRRAAPAHSTLLLVETIVTDGPGLDWSKMIDINMLALFGGRQRTQREFEELLDKAGFALQRVIDTRAGISIVEAKTA